MKDQEVTSILHEIKGMGAAETGSTKGGGEVSIERAQIKETEKEENVNKKSTLPRKRKEIRGGRRGP